MASYLNICLSLLVASIVSALSQQLCPLDLSPFGNTDISLCKGTSLSSSCCNVLNYVENTIAFSNSDLYAAVITNSALQSECVTAYKTKLNSSGVTANPFTQCPNAYLLRPLLINSTNACPELYLQDVAKIVNFTALALNCTTQTAGCTTCLSSIQAYATALAGAGAPTSTVLDCGIVVAQLLVNQEGAIANEGVVTIDRTNLCTQQLTSFPPPNPPPSPPSPVTFSPPPSPPSPPSTTTLPPPGSVTLSPPGTISSPPPTTTLSPPGTISSPPPATTLSPPGTISSPPPATTLLPPSTSVFPPPSTISTPPSVVPPSIAPSTPPSLVPPPSTPSPSVTPAGAPPPPPSTIPSPSPVPASSPTPAPGPATTPSTAPAPSPSLVPAASPSGAPVPAPAVSPSGSPTESPSAPPPPTTSLSPPPVPGPSTFPPTTSSPPPPRSSASHSGTAMAVSGILLLVSFALLA